MKFVFGLCCVILLLQCQTGCAKPAIIVLGARRCINMWDEGCINGQLPGAGNDDDYLNGGFNPGKRCLNVWDEDCNNGPVNAEDNYNFGSTKYLGNEGNRGEDLPGRRILYQLLEEMRRKHQVY